MFDEINEVKEKIDEVFDTAMRTEDSQIENIVLVTFNDPDAELRTVTNNLSELKIALASIDVKGGAYCPEYSLTGLKLALQNSLPYSLVFVFTDASAADYTMFEEIKRLAVKKSVRIYFVLTGECRSVYDDDYQVYYKLATATHGRVFREHKGNIKDIMPYVIQNIRSRRHVLVPERHPQVHSKKFYFTVYGKNDTVYITIRAREPIIQILDSQGRNVETERILNLGHVLAVKLQPSQPGVFRGEATVTRQSNTIVRVFYRKRKETIVARYFKKQKSVNN
ncbi:unnamed protein product [Arctia plantaginis]|uniref:Hemicentin-1-like von Willebrand factor A domain-containing protein n=1 Tax=Arctia plantaginis TaxID=874455 RepID=A0A8S0YSZ7_ARCPL|nr:unnamed protein product [Arctia plantaginis]